jgi:hypothetical protein
MERDSAGIEPGQCDGREPPIGLGAEERMVDTKAMEVVVEECDRLVWLSISSVSDRVRATRGQTYTQLHCARFQSARDRTYRAYAKIVQLYQSRTNRSSAAATAFLSPHFRFQDLTQYQE